MAAAPSSPPVHPQQPRLIHYPETPILILTHQLPLSPGAPAHTYGCPPPTAMESSSEDIPLILPHRVLPLPLGVRPVKPPKGSLHRILLGRKALVAPQPLCVPTRGRPRHFKKADAGFFLFFFKYWSRKTSLKIQFNKHSLSTHCLPALCPDSPEHRARSSLYKDSLKRTICLSKESFSTNQLL